MPTLLSINNYFYRRDGSEVVYLDHNRVLESQHWNVIPFSMQHQKNISNYWSKYFVSEIEFGNQYTLWEKIRRIPKVVYSFEARKNITKLVKGTMPDICHCHSIYHHISPSILGAIKRSGVPIVMTLHDLKIACPAYHMFQGNTICEQCRGGKVYKVMSNRCIKKSLSMSGLIMFESALHNLLGSYRKNIDRFISPCQFYINKLVEWGWDKNQFIHIPNPIDLDQYTACYEPGESILYFGRLSSEKGLLTLIRAASNARVALRFAGDGPQRHELMMEAKKLSVDATFLGHLDNKDLIEEIKKARVTVLPSEWYENAPMSILESYALGKPVIAADIGGIPELVQDGLTGTLFQSGAVMELAHKLKEIKYMTDSDIKQMGSTARQYVEENYSSKQYIKRILTLYNELGVCV